MIDRLTTRNSYSLGRREGLAISHVQIENDHSTRENETQRLAKSVGR